MAQAFDAASLHISGQPMEVASRVAVNPALGASLEIAHFSGAGDSLAFFGTTPGAMNGGRRSITVVQDWMTGLPR